MEKYKTIKDKFKKEISELRENNKDFILTMDFENNKLINFEMSYKPKHNQKFDLLRHNLGLGFDRFEYKLQDKHNAEYGVISPYSMAKKKHEYWYIFPEYEGFKVKIKKIDDKIINDGQFDTLLFASNTHIRLHLLSSTIRKGNVNPNNMPAYEFFRKTIRDVNKYLSYNGISPNKLTIEIESFPVPSDYYKSINGELRKEVIGFMTGRFPELIVIRKLDKKKFGVKNLLRKEKKEKHL